MDVPQRFSHLRATPCAQTLPSCVSTTTAIILYTARRYYLSRFSSIKPRLSTIQAVKRVCMIY